LSWTANSWAQNVVSVVLPPQYFDGIRETKFTRRCIYFTDWRAISGWMLTKVVDYASNMTGSSSHPKAATVGTPTVIRSK
jgi:hypothetical protein